MSDAESILDREAVPTPSNDATAIRRMTEQPNLSPDQIFMIRVFRDALQMSKDNLDTLVELRTGVPEDDEEAYEKYAEQLEDIMEYRKNIKKELKRMGYY